MIYLVWNQLNNVDHYWIPDRELKSFHHGLYMFIQDKQLWRFGWIPIGSTSFQKTFSLNYHSKLMSSSLDSTKAKISGLWWPSIIIDSFRSNSAEETIWWSTIHSQKLFPLWIEWQDLE